MVSLCFHVSFADALTEQQATGTHDKGKDISWLAGNKIHGDEAFNNMFI